MAARERTHRVRSGGTSLNVRVWPSRRRPVVLHHGFASSSHIWDLVAPILARSARVIAYDARGHGESGTPRDGFDLAQTARDLSRVCRSLDATKPVVVGHSWGANVALELAATHPRHVAGIVLLDGGFLQMRDRMDWATARQMLAPPRLAGMKLEDLLAGARAMWGRHWSPALEQVVLSFFRVRGGRVRPRLARASHMRILRALFEQPTLDLLARVRVPALVLAARPARPSPVEAGFLEAKKAAAIAVRRIGPPVRFEWIAGIHDVPLQHPAAVAARIASFASEARGAGSPERP